MKDQGLNIGLPTASTEAQEIPNAKATPTSALSTSSKDGTESPDERSQPWKEWKDEALKGIDVNKDYFDRQDMTLAGSLAG